MEFLRQILVQLVEFLRSYGAWWARAVGAVFREFGVSAPTTVSDIVGIALGGIFLLAFLRRLAWWDRKGDKPQPFPLKTTQTPNEVVAADMQKLLMVFLKIALFILFVVVVVTSR